MVRAEKWTLRRSNDREKLGQYLQENAYTEKVWKAR